jgi:signal peptidase II
VLFFLFLIMYYIFASQIIRHLVMKLTIGHKATLIIVAILLIDQLIKIWIKTHMMLGESYSIFGDWSFIHFTENYGMAFGLEFWGKAGKIVLSLFRIAAVVAIGYYMHHLIRTKKATNGSIVGLALIMAGALGNILDSAFYGLIFNDSWGQIAQFLPEGGGYASFLHGRVVDMFYFPLVQGAFPSWFPVWGGEEFIFFRPVFNFADASISVGVVYILLFQRKLFAQD